MFLTPFAHVAFLQNDYDGHTNFITVSGVKSAVGADSQPAAEAALKCRSCREGRYPPPVHIINLTATQQIPPYQWVHPDENVATLRFFSCSDSSGRRMDSGSEKIPQPREFSDDLFRQDGTH